MKFKKKDFVTDIAIGFLIFIMGIFLLFTFNSPLDNNNQILFMVMVLIAMLKFIQYIFTRDLDKRNYEPLLWAISCVLAACSAVSFNDFNSNYVVTITLLSWVGVTSIIKLISIDKMMSKNDETWKIKLIDIILFIVTGLVTCLNLYFKVNDQVIILGFYFCLLGIIELFYPFIGLVVQEITFNKSKK